MLAPMQGVTNRALRSLLIETVRPDLVFTEFMRVSGVSRKRLRKSDLRDIAPEQGGVPLVVQLVGYGVQPLVSAALLAQERGAVHINLNVGCPFGRMTTSPTGGALLRHPETLHELLPELRRVIQGSFSVKIRAGYDDPRQILGLLPLLEGSGVDFLVLHPRTVVQQYQGEADHRLTEEVVRAIAMPVIANGDIRTAAGGHRLLQQTGAAGLMLGRGAIADPTLFQRLRNPELPEPDRAERSLALRRYLHRLTEEYAELFCGEKQVLDKLKKTLLWMDDPEWQPVFQKMKKARGLDQFGQLVDELV